MDPTNGEKENTVNTVPNTGDPHSLQDLTNLIQELLGQTQTRFQTMSDQIIERIDGMGKRIDELEKNIGELMQQAGVEDKPAA